VFLQKRGGRAVLNAQQTQDDVTAVDDFVTQLLGLLLGIRQSALRIAT